MPTKKWTMLVFTLQTCISLSVTIVARLSFMGDTRTPFQPTTILLLTELIKLVLALCMNHMTKRNDVPTLPTSKTAGIRGSNMVAHYSTTSQMVPAAIYYAVPALLYSISNAIIFYTVGILSPAEFVLLWQSKIASTALLYRFVLKRSIAPLQWVGLAGVLAGVLILELSIDTVNDFEVSNSSFIPLKMVEKKMSRSSAILTTLFGATIAACAGVGAESVYKRYNENIWCQNARLSSASLFFYSVSSLIQSEGVIDVRPSIMFAGFNAFCFLLIFLQALLGFGVGYVLKYFDVILGMQSATAAMVANVLISIIFFDLKASPVVIVGTAMVIISIYTYHTNKPKVSIHVHNDNNNNNNNSNSNSNSNNQGTHRMTERRRHHDHAAGGRGSGCSTGGGSGTDDTELDHNTFVDDVDFDEFDPFLECSTPLHHHAKKILKGHPKAQRNTQKSWLDAGRSSSSNNNSGSDFMWKSNSVQLSPRTSHV